VIALLLTFPVFQAQNLLFKLAYAAQGRRLRFLCRRKRLAGFEDVALEADLDLSDRRLRCGSAQVAEIELGKVAVQMCFAARRIDADPISISARLIAPRPLQLSTNGGYLKTSSVFDWIEPDSVFKMTMTCLK
jgi:hypothetical protein